MVAIKGPEVALAIFAFLSFSVWSILNNIYSQIPSNDKFTGQFLGQITSGFFWAWFVPVIILIILAVLYFMKE